MNRAIKILDLRTFGVVDAQTRDSASSTAKGGEDDDGDCDDVDDLGQKEGMVLVNRIDN